MLGRIKETDLIGPYRERGYFYYSRTEKGKQYPIYCRKKGSLEAPEEVLLDLNALAEGDTFMAVGALQASATTATCSPTRPTSPASASTRSHVKDLAHGRAARDPTDEASRRWPGRPTTGRSSTRRRRRQAAVPPVPPRARRRRERRAALRGEGRALPASASSARAAALPRVLERRQPDDVRGALLCRRPSRRARWQLVAPRVQDHEYDVGPPRRPLLHPHQRPGPQLPPRHGAGRESVARRTGRSSSRTATT